MLYKSTFTFYLHCWLDRPIEGYGLYSHLYADDLQVQMPTSSSPPCQLAWTKCLDWMRSYRYVESSIYFMHYVQLWYTVLSKLITIISVNSTCLLYTLSTIACF